MLASYQNVRSNAGFAFLPSLKILQVFGTDSAKLLHGLFSNDMEGLATGRGCLSHLLNPKGKVQAEVVVLRQPESFLLMTTENTLPLVQRNIQMRIFRADVKVEALGNFSVLALYGPKSAEILKAQGFDVPQIEYAWTNHPSDGGFIVRVHDIGQLGFYLIAPAKECEKFQQRFLAHGLSAIDPDLLKTLYCEAGKPTFGVDYNEENFSLEANLAKAVSITKGCYLGQEPVARLFSRGQLAKRLHGFTFSSATLPPAQTVIFQNDQEVGVFMSTAFSPHLSKNIALGLIKTRVLGDDGQHPPSDLFFMAPNQEKVLLTAHSLPFFHEPNFNFLAGGPAIERVIAPNPKTIPK